MFRQILFTQWKWSGWIVVTGAVLGFLVPVLSVRLAGAPLTRYEEVEHLLTSVRQWGILYPVLAVVAALVMAGAAWAQDHRGGHVYALTLPLPRWRYVLHRFGAGAVLLAPIVLAVWVGGLAAASTAVVPTGLTTHPTALALRFTLALLLVYALFFAISSGTSRTAGYVLVGVGALVALQLLFEVAGMEVPLLTTVFGWFQEWPGPFEILTGRWMLINV